MRAVIYARCSTEEESQKDALANQVREAKECVDRMGWVLVDTYIESRSGTTTKGRTEYKRLYDDLQGSLFEVIVIKSQDRLMRNTKDWYLFVDRLCTNRKKLYIYIENKFYTADDALITGIKAILAEEYSRELSKKINNAHQNRQKNGGSVILTSNAYGFRKLFDGSVELIESEAEIKRRMYQLCTDGYGTRTIANILKNEGIRKRNGKVFSANDILRILRNPLNMGTAVMHKRHFDFETKQLLKIPKEKQYWHNNKVPSTVSPELWMEANRNIDFRSRKFGTDSVYPAGRRRRKYDLSGKLVCGICGAPYYRRVRKSGKEKSGVVEWKCKTYLVEGRKGCNAIHVEENKLLKLLQNVCTEQFLADRESVIRETVSLLYQVLEKDPAADKIQSFTFEEDRIKEQQDRLLDKLLQGILTDEVYQRRQKSLEGALQNFREKKREIENRNVKKLSKEQRLKEIEKFLREGTDIERAAVNKMLEETEKIMIYPRYMEIIYNPANAIGIEDENKQPEQKIHVEYGTLFDPLKNKEEMREQVIEMIRAKPTITAKEIAMKTGTSLSGAQYKLKVLKQEGSIRFHGCGGKGKWEIVKQ